MSISKTLQPGSVINGYEFLEFIGSGSYARVVKVRSLKFDTIFAAKILSVDRLVVDKTWEAFDSEINALLRLDHPHIIRLYDHFRVQNEFFLILEYCPGGSLWDAIRRNGPLKETRLCEVVDDICSAISYAWSNGIAHRDIKPQNVLLDEFGRVKLADFGISLTEQSESVCHDFRCSMAFAAPEVLKRLPHCPMKADVWSLGVTIATLAKGCLPWDCKSIVDMSRLVQQGAYSIPVLTPTAVKGLVKKMIVVEPGARMSIVDFECSREHAMLKKSTLARKGSMDSISMTKRKVLNASESHSALPAMSLLAKPRAVVTEHKRCANTMSIRPFQTFMTCPKMDGECAWTACE